MRLFSRRNVWLVWLLAISITAVQAAPLISQLPNAESGEFSDSDCGSNCAATGTTEASVADDFNTFEASQIAAIRLWGGYFPSNSVQDVDAFTYAVYPEDGNVPSDTALPGCQGPLAVRSRTNTGVLTFGYHRHEYWVTPSTPCVIGGAGTYWIEIYNNTVGNSDVFSWETGQTDVAFGNPGIAHAKTTPGTNWLPLSLFDQAFELFSSSDFCPSSPQTGCTSMDKAKFKANLNADKQGFIFKAKGNVPNLGNPAISDNQRICAYDKNDSLIMDIFVAAGGQNSAGKDAWKSDGISSKYNEPATNTSGAKILAMKTGTKVVAKAQGDKLTFSGGFQAPIKIQQGSSNGHCLESEFTEVSEKNGIIKGKKQ